MRTVAVAFVTTLAALLQMTTPVLAQQSRDERVQEILSDIYAPIDHAAPIDVVRGSVVEHREGTLILRDEEGRLHTINTAGLDAAVMARLEEGRDVMVALKSGSPGAMPIAAAVEAIEVQPSASIGGRALDRVRGSVERIGIGTLTLKTDAGVELTVDTTQVTEPVRLRPGDAVTIVGTLVQGVARRFVAEEIVGETDSPPASR